MKKILDESYLLAKIENNKAFILHERKSNKPFCSASLTKIFFAAEILRLIDIGKIKNNNIKINQLDIDGFGTDVLSDLVNKNNKISVDTLTLIGLMIKYSCNSSTKILVKKHLPDRKVLQNIAISHWKLKNTKLIDSDGVIKTDFSLQDLLIIFKHIYNKQGKNWNFLREKLRTSRNIYYLFDQLKLNVLGSKSGTIKIDDKYHISDCGIIKHKNNTYFVGAMVTATEISDAILRIRKIGKKLLNFTV